MLKAPKGKPTMLSSSDDSLNFSDDDISTASDEDSPLIKNMGKSKNGVQPSWSKGGSNQNASPRGAQQLLAKGPASPTVTSGRRAGNKAEGVTLVSDIFTDGEPPKALGAGGRRRSSGVQGSFAKSMPTSSTVEEPNLAKPQSYRAVSMKDLRMNKRRQSGGVSSGDDCTPEQDPLETRGVSPPFTKGGVFGGGNPAVMAQLRSTVDKTKPVNGAIKLRKIIQELVALRRQLVVNTEDIGDGAFRHIQSTRTKLEQAKEKAAKQICDIGETISCEQLEVKKQVAQLVDEIFNETDHRSGNAQLMAALARITSIDLPNLIVKRQWLEQCGREGCPEYLDIFLGFRELYHSYLDDVDNLQAIMLVSTKNQLYKARLYLVLSHHAPKIPGFVKHAKSLSSCWQQAFESIAVKPKSDQSEANEGRAQALAQMMGSPHVFWLNFSRESSQDKQTIFSRAARDGEVSLMVKILQDSGKEDGQKININRVSSDGSTALMQAVVANQKEAVALLLKSNDIDINKKHPTHGTALDLANKRGVGNVDRDLLKLLQDAYRKDHGGGAEDVPDFMLSAEELVIRKRKQAKAAAIEDGSAVLRPMLLGSLPQFESVVRLVEEEGDQPKLIRDAGEVLQRAKVNLASKVLSISHNVLLKGREECEMMIQIMHLTVLANERRPGSVEFFRQMLDHIVGPMNWADVCVEKNWLLRCAADTSGEFLKLLLALEDMGSKLPTETLVELVTSIANNQTLRIPLMQTLLSCEAALQLQSRREHLNPILQLFFANIASVDRAIPREDRNGRMQLLRFMLMHDFIGIDVELEEPLDKRRRSTATGIEQYANDGLNVFVRAANEGDVELVKMLVDSRKIRKLDRPLTMDGSTALVRAVGKGHTSTAEYLVKNGASAHYKGFSQGSPMELAKKRNDPILLSVLENAASQTNNGKINPTSKPNPGLPHNDSAPSLLGGGGGNNFTFVGRGGRNPAQRKAATSEGPIGNELSVAPLGSQKNGKIADTTEEKPLPLAKRNGRLQRTTSQRGAMAGMGQLDESSDDDGSGSDSDGRDRPGRCTSRLSEASSTGNLTPRGSGRAQRGPGPLSERW